MHIVEAARWFANTELDGWDGTRWVLNISRGDFMAFDRFISERTFGVKKRIIHVPQVYRFDPSAYPLVRTVDGKIWIVVSDNADIEGRAPYAQSYLLLEATLQAQIIEHTTQTLSSGAQGPDVETVLATEYCDLERYSGTSSDTFGNVSYGLYEVTFPGSVTVSTEYEVKIAGTYYEIREVIPELHTVVCRVLKRG